VPDAEVLASGGSSPHRLAMVAIWLSAAFDAFLDNFALPFNKHIGSIDTSPGHFVQPFNRFVDHIYTLLDHFAQHIDLEVVAGRLSAAFDDFFMLFDHFAQHTDLEVVAGRLSAAFDDFFINLYKLICSINASPGHFEMPSNRFVGDFNVL